MNERPIAIVDNCQSGITEVYRISFDRLAERFGKCEVGPKDGKGIVPAEIEIGPRKTERVKTVSFLMIDVEADADPVKDENDNPLRDKHNDIIKRVIGPEPPSLDDMLAELSLHGLRYVLYTTYSHNGSILPEGTEHPRYRLTFDLSRPLLPHEIKPIGLHVAAMLGIADCIDTSCLEPARLFYLPRCPVDRLSSFQHGISDGEPLDVDTLLAEATKIEQAQKSSAAGRRGQASGNVIQAFNDQADFGQILEQHGYRPKDRNRWIAPSSTSGLPGVRRLPKSVPERIYSSHSGDPLADGKAHDAFDCWCILNHGGDVSKAVREAAHLLGLDGRKSDYSDAGGARYRAQGNDVAAGDSEDFHRNAPKPDEVMLYGLAGDVGRAAAATTEANRYAVAAGFLTFLSAAVGRDVYLPVGNTKHHARVFTLHVGRSGRGRKGDALSLVQRIRLSVEELHRNSSLELEPYCGGHHHGGLSTREGLAYLIHDGYQQGKEEVPAIRDKRLWVIESEFANVLHQAKRDGNTLSAALRDCWDGVSIRPATKTSRLWASDPHVALSAAITPYELLNLMENRELSNGFANRFLIFWSERERLIPFPTPTSQAVVDDLVTRTMQVIKFARGNYPDQTDSKEMSLSPAAQAEYQRLYRGELTVADGDKVTAILERRPPIVLRLAMLYALTDQTHVIDTHHLAAAMAWARFHRDSVKFIFNDAAGEEAVRVLADAGTKILRYLQLHGKTSRTDLLVKCFSRHLSAKHLDDALDALLMDSPPRIVMTEGELLENGKRGKFYSLTEVCEVGESGEVAHSAGDSQVRTSGEVGESGFQQNPASSQLRQVRTAREPAETQTNRPSSPSSPNSHQAEDFVEEMI